MAWAAGVVESEGCLRITSTVYVSVTNTDRDMLARFQAIFALGRIRPCGGTNRAAFRWEVYGANARSVLLRVRPYLVTKQEQADLLLAHTTGQAGRLTTPEVRAARAEIRARLAYLKRHPST